MTLEEFGKFVSMHPHLVEQFQKDRRIWISHIPSGQLRSFTAHLSELLKCELVATQIEPEFESVFYDPEASENTYNTLHDLAFRRARGPISA